MRAANLFSRLSFGLVLLLPGCSSKGGDGGTGPGPTPTIALSLGSSAASVVQGGNAQVPATLIRGGGYNGTVGLDVQGAPAGVTGAVSGMSTSGGATTATVTISVAAATVPGTYSLTVIGTGSGVSQTQAPFTLTVTAAPDFALSLAPAAASVVQGGSSAPIAVTISRTNFNDPVTLSLGGTVPAGVSAAFTPPAGTTASSLVVSATAAAAPGVYNLTVDGTGTPGSRSTPLTLTVTAAGSFVIGVTPVGAVTLPQGGNDNSKTITITRTSYAGNVSLTAEGLPAGLTAAFAPNPAGGNAAVLTLTAGAAVAPNTYSITIRGTGAASLKVAGAPASIEATTTLSVTVTTPGSFTLVLAPACAVGLSMQQNSLDDSRVIGINRTNFPIAVALSVDNLPAGLTASFSGSPTAGNSSVMTLTSSGAVATGNYSLTIRGNGAGTQTTVILPLTVTTGPAPTPNVLDYAFPGGAFEGWAPGAQCATVGSAEWGLAFPQVGGYIGLDGQGNPGVANSWFSKLITLPANATTVDFEASGIAANGAGGQLRIRILDNGVSTQIFNQNIPGAPPTLVFLPHSADVSPWAGKTVRVFFEQDDNGINGNFPGSGEQVYLDNIHFRTAASPSDNVTLDFSGCVGSDTPSKLFVQDGSGPWTMVTGNGTVYTFAVTQPKAGILRVLNSTGGGVTVDVEYLTKLELQFAPPYRFCATDPIRIGVNATVQNAAPGDQVAAGMGNWTNFSVGNGPIQIAPTIPGPFDLVGYASGSPDRMVLIPNLNPPDNGTVGPVDFLGGFSFLPGTGAMTVTGLQPGETAGQAMSYHTGTACHTTMLYSGRAITSSVFTMRGAANSITNARPSDFHELRITTVAPGSTISRTLSLSFHTMGNGAVTLGSNLAAPVVSALAGAYKRLQALFTLPPEYHSSASFSYVTTSGSPQRSVVVGASYLYLGAPGSQTLAMPDMAGVAGWNDADMPSAARTGSWSVTATERPGANRCVEGWTMLTATRAGTF